jgi:hypothetical protein
MAIVERVQGNAPSYSLTADPSSTDLQPGQSVVFNITATSLNGFSGVVNFSCGELPTEISCSFAPTSVAVAAGQSASVQLIVTAGLAALAQAEVPAHHSQAPMWAMFTFGLVGCVFLDSEELWKRARALRGTALVLVLLALTGCGSGGPRNVTYQARSTTIQVRATTARTSQHLNLAIVVHR